MLNPQETSKISSSKFQNQTQLGIYKQAVTNLMTTLSKSIESRHYNDQAIIQNFIQLSPFFKDLQMYFSSEFSKNLVKRGKVYCINGKRRIYEKGEQMVKIIMPLIGNFFKRSQHFQSDQSTFSIFAKLEQLIQYPYSKVILRKKASTTDKRMAVLIENNELKTTFANFKQIDKLIPFSNEQSPFISGLDSQVYQQDLYANGQTWVFAISVEVFKKCIFQEYEFRLIQKANYFRKMQCFKILDDEQLKIFVERILFIELKKDQYVFKEGEVSQNIYLLVQGEAKALRTVQLFKEDPNCLYRGVSKSQAGRRTQKPPQFSYADFEGVYNYSPQRKRMELGILAPVTIFGEEEVAGGVPRQADVQITSTKAKMFVFTLKDIEAAGNGKKVSIDTFINELYDSITSKRIIVRREGLSSNLELQNRRKMNYFFIEPSQSQKKISQSRSRTAKERINKSISPAIVDRPNSPVKPRYHNFNFNQFIRSPRKSTNLKLSSEEYKIAAIAHNSGEIQSKIEASSHLSHQRQSYKHKINIATPLFDNNYYKRQRKQILRIQNKKRMRMFEVTGLPTKNKNQIFNSSVLS